MIDPVLPWNWDRCANGREQKEDYGNHLDHIHLCIFYFYLLFPYKQTFKFCLITSLFFSFNVARVLSFFFHALSLITFCSG
jgi:hypothetical protein